MTLTRITPETSTALDSLKAVLASAVLYLAPIGLTLVICSAVIIAENLP